MDQQKFSIRSRVKSFSFAIEGFRWFLIREHNARIHLAATILVVIASVILGVTSGEAIALTLTIGMVWVAEMINTCIERTVDLITRMKHAEIKYIKDLAAGAVLVAAGISVITGLIIFVPKCIALAHA